MLGITILGLLTTWSIATARYGGPDEPAHVLRAASVARGQVLGNVVPQLVGGFRSVTVPAPLTTGDPRCFRHDRRTPATCAVADATAKGLRTAATTSGTYPPWYYAMVGLPVRLVGDASSVPWYRLLAALWCTVALVVAISRSRRATTTIVIAAVAPAAWFLFGVVNPNSLEIALTLIAWVGVERVRTAVDPPSSELWWIGGPMALAILIRPIAAVALGTMVIVLLLVRRGDQRLGRARWQRMLVAPAVAVVLTLAWSAWSNVSVSDSREASPLDAVERLQRVVSVVPMFLREVPSSLGWREFAAPWPATALWWGLVVLVAGCIVTRTIRSRQGSLLVAWSLTGVSVVIVPIAFETVFAGRIGFIWQGRYSIPTALGLIVLGSTLVADLVPDARWAIGIAAALAEFLTFWGTLRRYTVGSDGSWWFRDAAWHPRAAPGMLLLANAALMSWLLIAGNRMHVSESALEVDGDSASDPQADLAERGRNAAQR
ncbi:MAG: putative rane protein [Ilumatobacteraceae bacterium]|nr:putative rane protein [Ilumatobacteraceae bacterium]